MRNEGQVFHFSNAKMKDLTPYYVTPYYDPILILSG